MVGSIKFYDAKKGFGFIVSEDNEQIFFHFTGLKGDYKTPNKGDRVEYSITAGKRGDNAVEIEKA